MLVDVLGVRDGALLHATSTSMGVHRSTTSADPVASTPGATAGSRKCTSTTDRNFFPVRRPQILAGACVLAWRRRQNFGRNQALRAGFLKSLAAELAPMSRRALSSSQCSAIGSQHDGAMPEYVASPIFEAARRYYAEFCPVAVIANVIREGSARPIAGIERCSPIRFAG